MTWVAVLNTTDVDLRFTGTDGLLPANDFGVVDDAAPVVMRGLRVGAFILVSDASEEPEAQIAVERAALKNSAEPGSFPVYPSTLGERVTELLTVVGSLPARVGSLETDPRIEVRDGVVGIVVPGSAG